MFRIEKWEFLREKVDMPQVKYTSSREKREVFYNEHNKDFC